MPPALMNCSVGLTECSSHFSPFLGQNNLTCHCHGSPPSSDTPDALGCRQWERQGTAIGASPIASKLVWIKTIQDEWPHPIRFPPALGIKPGPCIGSSHSWATAPALWILFLKIFRGRQSPITCPAHDLYFLMFFLLSNLNLSLSPLLPFQWIVIFKAITYNFILKSYLEFKHWILVYR